LFRIYNLIGDLIGGQIGGQIGGVIGGEKSDLIDSNK